MLIKLLVYFTLIFSLFSSEKITLVTDEYEPIYGSKLINQGVFSEISYEAFKAEGIDLNLEFLPWQRAYIMAQNGQYTGLLGALYFENRAKDFIYSEPVLEIDIVIFAKKHKIPKFNNFSDLKNYKISVVRGYNHSKEFDNTNFLRKFESATIEDCVNLLLNDRVDIIAGPEVVILNYIQKKYSTRINTVEKIALIAKKPLHILISRENEKAEYYIEKFNNGLRTIKKNGIYDEILNKHSFL